MGYEIVLIAHSVYVLAMYSLAVKEYQCLSPHVIDNPYLPHIIEWFRCLPHGSKTMQRVTEAGFTTRVYQYGAVLIDSAFRDSPQRWCLGTTGNQFDFKYL